jgi:hypothetical protein
MSNVHVSPTIDDQHAGLVNRSAKNIKKIKFLTRREGANVRINAVHEDKKVDTSEVTFIARSGKFSEMMPDGNFRGFGEPKSGQYLAPDIGMAKRSLVCNFRGDKDREVIDRVNSVNPQVFRCIYDDFDGFKAAAKAAGKVWKHGKKKPETFEKFMDNMATFHGHNFEYDREDLEPAHRLLDADKYHNKDRSLDGAYSFKVKAGVKISRKQAPPPPENPSELERKVITACEELPPSQAYGTTYTYNNIPISFADGMRCTPDEVESIFSSSKSFQMLVTCNVPWKVDLSGMSCVARFTLKSVVFSHTRREIERELCSATDDEFFITVKEDPEDEEFVSQSLPKRTADEVELEPECKKARPTEP